MGVCTRSHRRSYEFLKKFVNTLKDIRCRLLTMRWKVELMYPHPHETRREVLEEIHGVILATDPVLQEPIPYLELLRNKMLNEDSFSMFSKLLCNNKLIRYHQIRALQYRAELIAISTNFFFMESQNSGESNGVVNNAPLNDNVLSSEFDELDFPLLKDCPSPDGIRVYRGISDGVFDSTAPDDKEKLRAATSKRKRNSAAPEGKSKRRKFTLSECPVCLEQRCEMLRKHKVAVVTSCGHIFCKTCIVRLMWDSDLRMPWRYKRHCPICRKQLLLTSLWQTDL